MSFPPSLIQQTRFFVKFLIRHVTSAFGVGEHRHETTAELGRDLNKLFLEQGEAELRCGT